MIIYYRKQLYELTLVRDESTPRMSDYITSARDGG